MWRDVEVGAVIWALIALPLAFSIHSFLHPPPQLTFAHGINADSAKAFLHYYGLHFSFATLFLVGDGNPANGPRFGALYLWMLPFIVVGLFARDEVTPRSRAYLWFWLLIYPFGGSLATDNDSHAHLMRALVGAPLFCLLATIGLLDAWKWFSRWSASPRLRQPMLIVFAAVVLIQFHMFCVEYFERYPAQSAMIFHFGDREMFGYIRAHERRYRRVCIAALAWWNYTAEVGYYMRGDALETIEGLDRRCAQPGTLLALASPMQAPMGARLVGTVQDVYGRIQIYLASIR
jgi:hypothetical protein